MDIIIYILGWITLCTIITIVLFIINAIIAVRITYKGRYYTDDEGWELMIKVLIAMAIELIIGGAVIIIVW